MHVFEDRAQRDVLRELDLIILDCGHVRCLIFVAQEGERGADDVSLDTWLFLASALALHRGLLGVRHLELVAAVVL